jgi:hypothetical protein
VDGVRLLPVLLRRRQLFEMSDQMMANGQCPTDRPRTHWPMQAAAADLLKRLPARRSCAACLQPWILCWNTSMLQRCHSVHGSLSAPQASSRWAAAWSQFRAPCGGLRRVARS